MKNASGLFAKLLSECLFYLTNWVAAYRLQRLLSLRARPVAICDYECHAVLSPQDWILKKALLHIRWDSAIMHRAGGN